MIAHAQSAAEEIIKSYNIGFTVESLQDIKEIIHQLSDEEYLTMHQNCLELGQKISNGFFLRHALVPFRPDAS